MNTLVAQNTAANSIIGSSSADALPVGRLVEQGGIGGKVQYGGPLHYALFGPNGCGKGMRVLVPTLLSVLGKSFFVLDPKGQLAAMTAKWRHQQGDEVKIVDPFGVLADIVESEPTTYRYLIDHGLVQSCGFNPLARLEPGSDSWYDDAAIIGQALIKVRGNDPHWSESAQGLVEALVMWERLKCGNRANLEHVRELLTEPDEWERFVDIDGKSRSRQIAGLRVTAQKMVREGGFEICSLAGRFMRENNEIDSIQSTAETQTKWLLSEPMRRDMKKDGIDFRDLKEGARPMTVYVILPSDQLEEKSVWLRLIVSEALRASLTPGGRRVVMLLDEFAALGHLPIVERLFGVVRDYRIQMMPVFQSLVQLKGLYKERWEMLLGMAGVVQSFAAGDLTTAEWLSKRSGETTVVASGFNQGVGHNARGDNQTQGLSYQQSRQPFILPQQFFGMQDGHTIAFLKGTEKPVALFSPMFNNVTSLAARALPNPYFYDDRKPPAIRRKPEKSNYSGVIQVATRIKF